MATVKGVNQTLIDAGGIAALTEGLVNGRVKCSLDHYSLTTGNLSGDVIKLFGLLPAGAKVIAIALSASATQSGVTVSVGDLDSATRYVSASTGIQTAAAVLWVSGTEYVIGTTDTSTTDTDRQIVVTTGGATAAAATLTAILLWTTD